ncbi:hypothetical protein NDU88_003420 [Pleurodeles waltl]|uniref:Uncharacterized protein n=1 Tax=Pleurodeles waltl TaxID=8319 RepID=A0AAV7REV4_PLEWA|nr:hypothetical protein NDU88_003420 [Pleurodeles waltl]
MSLGGTVPQSDRRRSPPPEAPTTRSEPRDTKASFSRLHDRTAALAAGQASKAGPPPAQPAPRHPTAGEPAAKIVQQARTPQ